MANTQCRRSHTLSLRFIDLIRMSALKVPAYGVDSQSLELCWRNTRLPRVDNRNYPQPIRVTEGITISPWKSPGLFLSFLPPSSSSTGIFKLLTLCWTFMFSSLKGTVRDWELFIESGLRKADLWREGQTHHIRAYTISKTRPFPEDEDCEHILSCSSLRTYFKICS